MTAATMACLISDDEGAALGRGRDYTDAAPDVGAVIRVSIDDTQPVVEHRVRAPEWPLLVLPGEGRLVAGHVQRVSFNPGDGCTCLLRVAECRPTSAAFGAA